VLASAVSRCGTLFPGHPLEPQLLEGAKKGAWVAALFDPFQNSELQKAYAKVGYEAFVDNHVAHHRARSMDVLSSQSNLAGYKAVLIAADTYGRAFPMMMTAAGTASGARKTRRYHRQLSCHGYTQI
jgi:NAD(P) transhydrogenase subunit alpha